MTLATSPVPTGTSRRNLLLTFRSAAAATLVGYGVNLIVVPVLLHRIGPELYGAWATLASILAVGALADAGIRTEVIRRVAASQGEDNGTGVVRTVHQGLTLLVALAAMVLLAGNLAAPSIRAFSFPHGVEGYGQAEVDLLIRAAVALLAVSLVTNGYFSVLRGLQRGDVETTGLMLSVPASAVVTIAGVWQGRGLWALFLGGLSAWLVTVLWSTVAARRLVPSLRFRVVALSRPMVKGYLALSGLALLSQLADVVDSQWDKVVLSRYVGSTAVTSFQIGTTLVLQGKALSLLPLAPLLVAIAELHSRDRARMEMLFSLMSRTAMVLGAMTLSAVFVFAPAFLRLWLGVEAAPNAAGAARLFTVAVAFNLLSAPLAFRAFGEGWHYLAAAGSGVNMVVNGALSLVLTMAIGFNGALYGSIAGNLAGSAFFLVLMRRRMGDGWAFPPWRSLAVSGAAASVALMLGAARISSWPALVAAGPAFLVVVGTLCVRAEGLRVTEVWSRAAVPTGESGARG